VDDRPPSSHFLISYLIVVLQEGRGGRRKRSSLSRYVSLLRMWAERRRRRERRYRKKERGREGGKGEGEASQAPSFQSLTLRPFLSPPEEKEGKERKVREGEEKERGEGRKKHSFPHKSISSSSSITSSSGPVGDEKGKKGKKKGPPEREGGRKEGERFWYRRSSFLSLPILTFAPVQLGRAEGERRRKKGKERERKRRKKKREGNRPAPSFFHYPLVHPSIVKP